MNNLHFNYYSSPSSFRQNFEGQREVTRIFSEFINQVLYELDQLQRKVKLFLHEKIDILFGTKIKMCHLNLKGELNSFKNIFLD